MFAFSFRFSQEQTVSYALTSEVLSGSTRRGDGYVTQGKGGSQDRVQVSSRLLLRMTGVWSPLPLTSSKKWVWKNALKLSPLRRRESSVLFPPTPISHWLTVVPRSVRFSALQAALRSRAKPPGRGSRWLQQNTTAGRATGIVEGVWTKNWQQMLRWSSVDIYYFKCCLYDHLNIKLLLEIIISYTENDGWIFCT